jgi:tRNA pseudouridine55 synthase
MAPGILLLDKPRGLSSNAALQRVRALLGKPKAGHVGSLDPLASGMLPICLGEATKIAGDILAGHKRYRFTVALGSRTATGDTEGDVVERAALPELSAGLVAATLAMFGGVMQQVPPMYSALKRDGQPLYKLARAGVEVERAPRRIELFELTLLEQEAGALTLETRCSKGTYIRVLAEDLARALGTVGHVTMLRRVSVAPFEGEPMQTLESVAAAREAGAWPPMVPADRALAHLPAVSLSDGEVKRLQHGQAVRVPGAPVAPRLRLHAADGTFLGLGEGSAGGHVQPRRMFNLE